jgi:predicted RNA-binding protein with TRAM domain
MRNSGLVLILCISSSLLGCSSKPSASDIATGLNEFWGACVKISDVTKTNGVDKGDAYQVAFTYKLEALEDTELGIHKNPSNCSIIHISTLNNIASFAPVKKGDVYTVTTEINMVKSEKGWIFQ